MKALIGAILVEGKKGILDETKEPLVDASAQNSQAVAARKRLQTVLDQLNPSGGIVDPGDGSGRHAKNVRNAKKAKKAKQAKSAE